MFWCHACSKQNHCSKLCSACSSEAVEQITSENNPKIFKPYTIQQQQDEPIYSLDSLYRNIYQDLFQTIRQRRTQGVRRLNNEGNYEISYVVVVQSAQDDQIKGLNQHQTDLLQKKIITSECSICQQIKQTPGFALECKHQYHQQCLLPWITKNGSCPSCRYKLFKQ